MIGNSLVEGFKIANWDTDTPAFALYAGFLARSGEWYIARFLTSDSSAGYVRGSEDYAANWTARAGLSYVPFDQAF